MPVRWEREILHVRNRTDLMIARPLQAIVVVAADQAAVVVCRYGIRTRYIQIISLMLYQLS